MDTNTSNEKWKEAKTEEDRMQDRSVVDFANKMMKRSLITGVANITETNSKYKKVFKLTVLVLCTCGFFYQATSFMQYILTFPSVVNIEVYIPENYTRPAYTFCNNNGIKRTKFCAKYPDRCTVPDSVEEFCKGFSSFCASLENKTHFTVVKEEFYDFEENITQEELLELGYEYESMVVNEIHSLREDNSSAFELASGPFIGRRPDNVLVICYSLFLRVESNLDPSKFRRPQRGQAEIAHLRLNTEPDEVFIPERPAGFLFHIHTPFTLENTIQKGIFIQPKHSYMILFGLEEDNLLPHPFPSDCVNFTESWLKNNRTGPRSQESCVEKCEMEFMLENCNCTFPEVFYPTTGPVCTTEYTECDMDNDEKLLLLETKLHQCNSLCKDDCQRFRYFYSHQFRLHETNPFEPVHDEINDDFIADVAIIAADQEILKYNYRPQYQKLDVFSSLGGFIGAWLGVSLVAVVDLLESLVNIVVFFFRRKLALRS